MPGVFISYRRDDSGGNAGRLFDVLAGRFGPEQTFMDLDDIKGGDDFTAVIGEKVSQCGALLAVTASMRRATSCAWKLPGPSSVACALFPCW